MKIEIKKVNITRSMFNQMISLGNLSKATEKLPLTLQLTIYP